MTTLFRRMCLAALIATAPVGIANAQPEEEEEPLAAPADGDELGMDEAAEAAPEEPQPPEPEPTPEASASGVASFDYNKGFLLQSSDEKFALKIGARVQGRYQFESADNGVDRDESSAFSIPRARLTLSGHAYTKDVKYKFQSDFGKGFVSLKDFLVDWKVGSMYVRVGQYKRPFSRQQINSSSKLELVDRAITDKAFGAGRDIGVMVHNNYEKSPELEWAVGLFNATGDKPTIDIDVVDMEIDLPNNVPDLFGPALVGRVGYNANGIDGYSEADFKGGPLRYGAAASVLIELDADDDDQSKVLAEADFIAKVNGISASAALYFATLQDDTSFFDQTYAAIGAHVQGGYMLTDKQQVVLRYGLVEPDGADNTTHEITGGFSWYQFKHGLKWQTDAGLLRAGDLNNFLVRTQLQLNF